MYMHPDIKSAIRCGKCSRICTGECCCIATYTNGGGQKAYVSLTPNYPSKIVPVDLSTVGGKLVAKKGSFMSSYGDVGVEASFDCCSCTCCFGGLGAVRQRVTGSGTAFLTAGGTILTRTLAPREKFIIDSASIVAYQESAQLGIQRTGGKQMHTSTFVLIVEIMILFGSSGCFTCCCGGEGLFNTTVTGPGLVIVESMPFLKYKLSMQY